jgi:hypothetical protein
MLLKISAQVESHTLVSHPVTILCGKYGIGLYPSEDGRLDKIEIVKPCNPPDNELPRVVPTPREQTKANIIIPSSLDADDLIELLQYLESLGSFWFGIDRIRWSESTTEWIPEGPEDRERLSLFSLKSSASYPLTDVPLNAAQLCALVAARDKYAFLVIPLAFLREGDLEFRAFRYASAFYQFYFYLEDLYGNGMWKTKAIQAEFLKSAHLNEIAAQLMNVFADATMAETRGQIREHLKRYRLEYRPEGLIKVLPEVRGELHHFSQKSRQKHAHPFNQRSFRGIAYLAMSFSRLSYPLIVRDGAPR